MAIAVGVLLLFIMVMSRLSSCGAMFSGTLNGVLGTSYTSEDSDLVDGKQLRQLENELQSRIDNIERDNQAMTSTAMTLQISDITHTN